MRGGQGKRDGRNKEIRNYLKIGLTPNSNPGGKENSKRNLEKSQKHSILINHQPFSRPRGFTSIYIRKEMTLELLRSIQTY